MSNVLDDEKKQQVLALGRLGWSLRRIEEATGVRRETASLYLKAAGVAGRAPRARGCTTGRGEDTHPGRGKNTRGGESHTPPVRGARVLSPPRAPPPRRRRPRPRASP